jgi:hypothetical protein
MVASTNAAEATAQLAQGMSRAFHDYEYEMRSPLKLELKSRKAACCIDIAQRRPRFLVATWSQTQKTCFPLITQHSNGACNGIPAE